MPSLFSNLNVDDIKGIATSWNPLNLFTEAHRPEPAVPNIQPLEHLNALGSSPTVASSHSSDSTGSLLLTARSDGMERRKSSGTSIIIMDNPARGRRSSPTKPKKKKIPIDTYCIVKPLASSSKNPLNLQIQLVVKPSGQARRDTTRSVSRISISTIGSTANTPTTGGSATGVVDISSSNEEEERGLSRSGSVGSEISAVTGSSFGVESVTSGSSRATKRVEPLFDLAVHNMLHTVVTDAATDAKVAKFMKRGVDFPGIGLLEPSEVWVTPPASLLQTFSSFDEGHTSQLHTRSRPLSVVSSYTAPLSPTATRSTMDKPNRASLDISRRISIDTKAMNTSGGEAGGAKKFFGKIFRKRGGDQSGIITPSPSFGKSSTTTLQPTSVPEPHSPNPNFGVNLRPPTSYTPNNVEHVSIGNPTFGTSPVVIRRTSSGNIQIPRDGSIPSLVPGTTPIPPPSPLLTNTTPSKTTTSSPSISERPSYTHLASIPNSNRPLGYTWTVKKWAKKNQEGWARSLVAAKNAGLEFVGGVNMVEGEDEVVFEWIRMRNPNAVSGSGQGLGLGRVSTGKGGSRPASRLGDATLLSEDGDGTNGDGGNDRLELPPPIQLPRRTSSPNGLHLPTHLDIRPEAIRRISGSSSTTPSESYPTEETQSLAPTVEDDTDSESPEDNETPWTCSVYVRRTGERRVLGTLTPAVHHPKVIGLLKMSSKIEGLELREVRQGGEGRVAKREVGLSEGDLKDAVCVTALWVIAREEFGGFGRKKKI